MFQNYKPDALQMEKRETGSQLLTIAHLPGYLKVQWVSLWNRLARLEKTFTSLSIYQIQKFVFGRTFRPIINMTFIVRMPSLLTSKHGPTCSTSKRNFAPQPPPQTW